MNCRNSDIPPAPPCAGCGTTGGYLTYNKKQHKRTSLALFGIEGTACSNCYAKMHQQRRKLRPATLEWLRECLAKENTLGPRILRLAKQRVKEGHGNMPWRLAQIIGCDRHSVEYWRGKYTASGEWPGGQKGAP